MMKLNLKIIGISLIVTIFLMFLISVFIPLELGYPHEYPPPIGFYIPPDLFLLIGIGTLIFIVTAIAGTLTSRRISLKTTNKSDDIIKGKQPQKVYFSIYTPTSISPDTTFIINVWAYLLKQKPKLDEIVTMKETYEERAQKGPILAEIGNVFQAYLTLAPPFKIIKEYDEITWIGEPTNSTFPVYAPEDVPIGTHLGCAKILYDGIQILQIDFTLKVGKKVDQIIDSTQNLIRLKRYFASYSREDQSEVLKRIQGLLSLGVEVFLDNMSIRQGEYWEDKIFESILNSDLFLLFWSIAARNSEWVEKEWNFALKNRGLDFIQPIPLEDPELAPPPKELESKQFNDFLLLTLKAIESIEKRTQKEKRETKFCPKCGLEIMFQEDKFCKECGFKL